MKRFKKILVYAGSAYSNDPALRRAAALARNNDASLEIVDVVEELPGYARLLAPASWDVAGMIAAEREKALQDLARSLEEDGLHVSTRILMGQPAVAITQHVISGQFDLLLKTARPEHAPHEQWYGTLAKRLLRICPCPVWIIEPKQSPRFARIVAAIDPNGESEEKTGLNRRIVEMASSLARQEGAELHLVHAWTAYGLTLMRNRMPKDPLEQYVSNCEAAARERVDTFLADFNEVDDNAQIHLLRGDPQDAIVDFVADQNIDLVVMGTVCRTGVSGYLIGNTAEKVLRHIGGSVLAVKPAGFQSPVRAAEHETLACAE